MRPVTRICCDCGERLKNRARATKRCRDCHFSRVANEARGRATGQCSGCGGRLSAKRNATGLCSSCYVPPCGVKRPHGRPAWNKGVSAYSGLSVEELRAVKNRMRRGRRALHTAEDFLADRVRTLIRNSLRRAGHRKDTKTAVLLGCSPAEFKAHIERQLGPGMSWENYGNGHGKWNIDHIRPLASFDLSKRENQLAAFRFSNCRPLWAIENVIKGCKPIEPIIITFGKTH